MSSLPVQAVLGIPAFAVLVLALISSYRLGSRLNALASGLTFALQKNWKFVVVSMVVMSALVYGLYAGHTGG